MYVPNEFNQNSLPNFKKRNMKGKAFRSIKDIIKFPYQDNNRGRKKALRAKSTLLQSGLKQY